MAKIELFFDVTRIRILILSLNSLLAPMYAAKVASLLYIFVCAAHSHFVWGRAIVVDAEFERCVLRTQEGVKKNPPT